MNSSPKTRKRKPIARDKTNVPLNIRKTESGNKNRFTSSKSYNIDGGKKSVVSKNLIRMIQNKSNSVVNQKNVEGKHHLSEFKITLINKKYTNMHVEKITSFENFIKTERAPKQCKLKRLRISDNTQNKEKSKSPLKQKKYAKSAPTKFPTERFPINKKLITKVRQKTKENIKNSTGKANSNLPHVSIVRNSLHKVSTLRKILPKDSNENRVLPKVLRKQRNFSKVSTDRIITVKLAQNTVSSLLKKVQTNQNSFSEVSAESNTKAKVSIEQSSIPQVPGEKKLSNDCKNDIRQTTKERGESAQNVAVIKQITDVNSYNKLKVGSLIEANLERNTSTMSKEDIFNNDSVFNKEIGDGNNTQLVEIINKHRIDKITDTFDIDKYAIDICKQTAGRILEKLSNILDRLEKYNK